MTGHAAERARARIVHLADEEVAVGKLRGRDAVAHASGRVEARVAQPQRLEDVLIEVAVERRARNPPHHLAQQQEARVAVLERAAGRIVERQLREQRRRLGEARAHATVGRDGRQPRAVREQPADRHHLVGVAAKLPQVAAERRVELHLAALDERHHGQRRAERLGQRGDVEDRVLGHRDVLRDHAPQAPRAPIDDLVAPSDHHDDTGDLAGGHHFERGLVDPAPVLRRRVGRRQRQRERKGQEDGRTERHEHAPILLLSDHPAASRLIS